ncbi:hypothetical protein NL529_34845, partial [Klebsiella pneumoniae]|nr:hypothetical protein [Klebsiella pneumoniae]
DDNHLLLERWDGTAWSLVGLPDPPGMTGVSLTAISCLSATSCVAVGSTYLSSTPSAFLERWDGSTWKVEFLPIPPG